MFKVVPFKQAHVLRMLEQKSNAHLKSFFTTGAGSKFEEEGISFSGELNGSVVICGSIKEIWPNRGFIWCVFDEQVKQNFVPVFRGIKKFLRESPFRRIEVCISPWNFHVGRRRAEMLGFKLECDRAVKFLPDGTDCSIYSLVRES